MFHPLHVVTLCSLANQALELHCLDEIVVPHQVLLVHAIHLLVLPRDVLQRNRCLRGESLPFLPRAE